MVPLDKPVAATPDIMTLLYNTSRHRGYSISFTLLHSASNLAELEKKFCVLAIGPGGITEKGDRMVKTEVF